MYKVQIPQELYEVIVEALKKENLYSGLLREETGKVRKNIFEEAYKHYVGKDDLHALRLFRRAIKEIVRGEKDIINEIARNLKNVAKVGDEYLEMFLEDVGIKNLDDLDEILDIRKIDYKDFDVLFMAAEHFLEAARTSILLRMHTHFHLYYYKFLLCFNLLKGISGSDELIKLHAEGMELIENLLREHYRLMDLEEIRLSSEEMFYVLENLKEVLLSKYEDGDFLGVVKDYYKLMDVLDAFERSLLNRKVQP
ncbi:hypothetical protein LM594_02130 [Candidatus Caldipriscus sp.]|nr:hypothetical protein [Candidatus Caldipriscus sp.]